MDPVNMKSKRRPESAIRRTESDSYFLNDRYKKVTTNFSLEKSLEFLKKHNNVYRNSISNTADADTYFRNLLRKHEQIDLFKDVNWSKKLLKSTKSFDLVKETKRSFQTEKNRKKLKTPRREVVILKEKEEFEDSQSSRTLINTESSATLVDINDDLLEDKQNSLVKNSTEKMAEESGETDYSDMEGEEDIKSIEDMIAEATKEMEEVNEDSTQLMTDLEAFKIDPDMDSSGILQELDDAERQAKETGLIINALKLRIRELLKTEKMTEVEAKELEEKNNELKAQMKLFEEKTKRIQFLLAQANFFDNMNLPKPGMQKRYAEDVLPKVLVCGFGDGQMPKIVVCEENRNKRCIEKKCAALPDQPAAQPQMVQELSQTMIDQLPDNAPRQSRSPTQGYLQEHQYPTNAQMACNLQTCGQQSPPMNMMPPSMMPPPMMMPPQHPYQQPSPRKSTCGRGKPCPKLMESRLNAYSETTGKLEKQLGDMECEVRMLQKEICSVQRERECLEEQKKLLCALVCKPKPCCPKHSCCEVYSGTQPAPCDQQLRELREQYNRLQDDFKSKITEISGIRADNEQLKATAKKAEDFRKVAEDKARELERELCALKKEKGKGLASKEQLIEQEQQLAVAKQRFREAQDELEELRALIVDLKEQLDDYRNKYLNSEQTVEEQRRQIDMMEMDNNRASEQVNLEIQRVKNQFQEKLQELTPLPDILKSTQMKLQEAQQMHLLAERNNEALVKELETYKQQVEDITNQLELLQNGQLSGDDELTNLRKQLEEIQEKYNELIEQHDCLRENYENMENLAKESEKAAEAKLHEIAQLTAQLESVREESARQVSRVKDRCETIRRSMQNQILDLERQLVHSRAQAKMAQKDRDEIRMKMQAQINNLNENFEDAQMRIRNLQGHVNFLKSSYNNSSAGDTDLEMPKPQKYNDPCKCD